MSITDAQQLSQQIKTWANELGFQQVAISDAGLPVAESELADWLVQGFHGDMHYMAAHGQKRTRPALLEAQTCRVISVSMNYLTVDQTSLENNLNSPHRATISAYALGRDYHKLMRKRLSRLGKKIQADVPESRWRAFTDSAPVMEKPLAARAGLGWMGKHTNLLNRDHGSWFFLGELYINLPLAIDSPVSAHCGQCQACLDICPTQAIIKPYQLDARRCISYLTIELKGAIPLEFRDAIGNRIYGCDDCQLVCPWNRFAQTSQEADFNPRADLNNARLLDLFAWQQDEFLQRLQGSPIRRIGYQRWLRNIAVALGNGFASPAAIAALQTRLDYADEMVREHIQWALQKLQHPSRPHG